MNDDKLYLLQILECMRQIQEYTRSGREAFMCTRMAQDAVIRNFEIIGEATKRVSDTLREKHPELPWRRVAGFRDVLIHQYDRVDLDEVWNIVEREVPDLKSKIEAILRALGGEPPKANP